MYKIIIQTSGVKFEAIRGKVLKNVINKAIRIMTKEAPLFNSRFSIEDTKYTIYRGTRKEAPYFIRKTYISWDPILMMTWQELIDWDGVEPAKGIYTKKRDEEDTL